MVTTRIAKIYGRLFVFYNLQWAKLVMQCNHIVKSHLYNMRFEHEIKFIMKDVTWHSGNLTQATANEVTNKAADRCLNQKIV